MKIFVFQSFFTFFPRVCHGGTSWTLLQNFSSLSNYNKHLNASNQIQELGKDFHEQRVIRPAPEVAALPIPNREATASSQ